MKNVPTSKDKIKFILKLNKIPTEIIVCIHPQINEKRINNKRIEQRGKILELEIHSKYELAMRILKIPLQC